MCGRFGGVFNGAELAERYELEGDVPKFEKSYNTAPSFTIPVVTRNSPNKALLMRWGFVPHWADPNKLKLKPINARDDSIEKPFYRDAVKSTRCIIPFSFFYEWKRFTLDGKEEKQPYLIRVKDEEIMGFAGLYSEKLDAQKRPLYTCCIITTKPNSLMEKIHDRMPVILSKDNEDKWLDHNTDMKHIKALLKPYDASQMEAYRVSTRVNSPRVNEPELTKPQGMELCH